MARNINQYLGGVVPPSALEIEKQVIGAILFEGNVVLDRVMGVFGPTDPFYSEKHSLIYSTIRRLKSLGDAVDLVSVFQEIKRQRKDEVISHYELATLMEGVINPNNAEKHAKVLIDKFALRNVLKKANKYISEVENGEDIQDILYRMNNDATEIQGLYGSSEFAVIGEVVQDTMNDISVRVNDPDSIWGVKSGFENLDKVTNGWQKTDLIIIAARPSMGKTAFALNLALNGAIDGNNIAFFSLEMGRKQIVERMLSTLSGVPLSYIKNGRISPNYLEALRVGSEQLSELPIFIDDRAGMNIVELRAKVQQIRAKFGLDMVVIDYIQLMSGHGNHHSRENEISTISRELKKLAMEIDIPIIALSQMSRDIEKRKGEPQLSDLRESGAIEQDANIVMFLSRGNYQVTNQQEILEDNTATILIKKNRNGKLDDIKLGLDLSIQKFDNLKQEREQGVPESKTENNNFIGGVESLFEDAFTPNF